MNDYLMLFRSPVTEGPAPTAEQMQQVFGQWQSWIRDLAAKGNFSSTNRLLSEGKTVKPGNVLTDGPYMEIKETIGGYVIVKAASLDEAVELAKGCPGLSYGSNVEVRKVLSIDSDPGSPTFLAPK